MAEHVRSYEDLRAWQPAMDACSLVCRVAEGFPNDERFGLVSQVRRAAVAVPSNIAEGYGRGSRQDYARFLRMARGSLYEVETQLALAVRLAFLGEPAYRDARDKLNEAGRVLAGLIRSIEP